MPRSAAASRGPVAGCSAARRGMCALPVLSAGQAGRRPGADVSAPLPSGLLDLRAGRRRWWLGTCTARLRTCAVRLPPSRARVRLAPGRLVAAEPGGRLAQRSAAQQTAEAPAPSCNSRFRTMLESRPLVFLERNAFLSSWWVGTVFLNTCPFYPSSHSELSCCLHAAAPARSVAPPAKPGNGSFVPPCVRIPVLSPAARAVPARLE